MISPFEFQESNEFCSINGIKFPTLLFKEVLIIHIQVLVFAVCVCVNYVVKILFCFILLNLVDDCSVSADLALIPKLMNVLYPF